MNQLTLNYIHTNIVIPSFLIFNYEDYARIVFPNPENMQIFIKKETFDKAKEKLNIPTSVQMPDVNLTAAPIGKYYVIFVEFAKEYVNNLGDNYAVAIAVSDDGFRYFTYEKGVNNNNELDYYVCEWEIDMKNQKINRHFNYGPTGVYGMSDFAYYVQEHINQKD